MNVCSDEWEGEEEAEDTPPLDTEWDLDVLHLERQVGVDTSGRLTEHLVHGSGRGLEVSGWSGGSQSQSGDHYFVVYVLLEFF